MALPKKEVGKFDDSFTEVEVFLLNSAQVFKPHQLFEGDPAVLSENLRSMIAKFRDSMIEDLKEITGKKRPRLPDPATFIIAMKQKLAERIAAIHKSMVHHEAWDGPEFKQRLDV